ncbi:D-alanine--D-alanine ligase [bioreactor metagenome]|uniref:D-alanine--D-alanine ligase n=1 Tax=bioreactor metagenome TaxID=1076179 RepID=A0A645C5X3_9ZZZZ
MYTGPNEKIIDLSWEKDTANLVPAILSPCSAHHGIMTLNKAEKKYEILKLDCVFPVLHGANGEDGVMQGLLKLSGIPFVGSRTRGAAITMDKAVTKSITEKYGIRQAKWFSFKCSEFRQCSDEIMDKLEKEFSYPVFVKPCNAGSSVGVTKVKSKSAFPDAVSAAAAVDDKVIVEESVKGREIEVAVLETHEKGKQKIIVSRCGEIIPNNEFYDYEAKYISNGSKLIIPASLDKNVEENARDTAKRIFNLTDCAGLARVDFFADENGVIFNEINAIPGFTKISMYPKLFENAGIEYKKLIDMLIAEAVYSARSDE